MKKQAKKEFAKTKKSWAVSGGIVIGAFILAACAVPHLDTYNTAVQDFKLDLFQPE